MNVLVTGGLGLIGHNVCAKLQQAGIDPIVVDNQTNYGIIPQSEIDWLVAERRKKLDNNTKIYNIDIVDSVSIQSLFKAYRPDTVIHLASFPRQKVVNANPMAGSRTMSEALLNLLELSVQNQVRKFVYVSSSMVYGDFQNQVREDAECRPIGQYGIMKLAGEMLVRDYTRRSGLLHTIIRPSAVYGPLDVEDRVISKFLLTAHRGGIIRVNGADETLDFTYVDDAANGIVAAAVKDCANNKTYNITKSHSHTLLDAAKLAVSIVGKGTIETREKDQDFPSRGALNIDAARADLGYDPTVDLEEGFGIYNQWIKNSTYWSARL